MIERRHQRLLDGLRIDDRAVADGSVQGLVVEGVDVAVDKNILRR